MGTSSKPLFILIDQSLQDADPLQWETLVAQGYEIEVIAGRLPDLYLAPYARRMTVDMQAQLPAAFTLAVKGARELRYGPTTKGATTWKGKHAQAKKPRARKNSTIKTQTVAGGESPVEADHQGTGGTAVSPVGETPNIE